MSRRKVLDVDDTSRCPRSDRCASCSTSTVGFERVWLDVATIATPVGVLCLTICALCVDTNQLPTLSAPEAVHGVAAHCEPLGCNLDEMAAALTEDAR